MYRRLLILSLLLCLPLPAAAGEYFAPPVARITLLTSDGGRVDWSVQNKIAFDRRGKDGYYGVWVMNPDGSGQTCLTCGKPGAPTRNKGNPAWHPSGKFIVFEAQKEKMLGLLNHMAEPGRGVGNDLWLMTADGNHYWKIVDADRGWSASGVLHPHFSPDGRTLFWGQLARKDGKLGDWELKLAGFGIREDGQGTPVLSNIRSFTPGPVHKFFESHGFTPDGGSILFTAQVAGGYADEFLMNLASGQMTDLTHGGAKEWNEHGQLTPDGRHIAWVSSRGIGKTGDKGLNLWLMNSDGSEQQKIIDFHVKGTPVYSDGIGPADSSWSPDGKSLAVYGITDARETQGNIYRVDFAW